MFGGGKEKRYFSPIRVYRHQPFKRLIGSRCTDTRDIDRKKNHPIETRFTNFPNHFIVFKYCILGGKRASKGFHYYSMLVVQIYRIPPRLYKRHDKTHMARTGCRFRKGLAVRATPECRLIFHRI